MAETIAQCGGIQVLISQLTAPQAERRAAGCRALYFLGWHGTIRRGSLLPCTFSFFRVKWGVGLLLLLPL